MGAKFLGQIVKAMFPKKCAICGKIMQMDSFFCENCDLKLQKIKNTKAPKLSVKDQYIDGCITPYFYKPPISKLICQYKFRGRQALGKVLSDLISDEVRGYCKNAGLDLIAFVPGVESGAEHIRTLAKRVSETVGIQVIPILKKLVANKKQHDLGFEERLANVIGVYAARDKYCVGGKRILLIDDVITTGATINECAKVLKQAGAASVFCVAVAATEG